MAFTFPSDSWTQAYGAALDACPDYNAAGRGWNHGAIALVVRPAPELGLEAGFGTWLDVEDGRCREARAVTLEEAQAAPFCISADYHQWRAVLEGRLNPIAGLLTRALELRGDLRVILRYVRSAQAMVACAGRVPAAFLELAA